MQAKRGRVFCQQAAGPAPRRCENYGESDWWQYARSKLLNILMAKEFAVRLHGSGIQSFVAHPGLAVTDHFGKSDSENKLSSRIIETYANSPIGQTAEGGASPLEYACTADALDGEWGEGVGQRKGMACSALTWCFMCLVATHLQAHRLWMYGAMLPACTPWTVAPF